MRVIVDRDRCEGNAVCLGIAPDIFDLDDEDYAVVKTDPIPVDQEDLAEQAIAECRVRRCRVVSRTELEVFIN